MSPKKHNHSHYFGIVLQTFSHTIMKTYKEYSIKLKSDIYSILLIVYNSFIFAVCLVFSSIVIFHLIFLIITEDIFVV